ncbi:MAG TPA: glutathione S-transferase N-terminal domain-containing protein [Myxococcota bacterium]
MSTNAQIDLYTWKTPNGRKVSILLEELGLAYDVHAVDISKDEQFAPEFLKIAPNNKIPAIVDRRHAEPVSVFETGAIMAYLCETTPGGERFWPTTPAARAEVHQWLMWQMGGVGPFFGRTYRFLNKRPKDPENGRWVADEFLDEATRLLKVLDGQLKKTGAFMSSTGYSIADMATWTWVNGLLDVFAKERPELGQLEHVKRWRENVGARHAVQKGNAIP